jgi:Spy/CpxP family protein refolding chaperone
MGGLFGAAQTAALSVQYARLLNAPTVQKELKLTDDQIAKLKEARDKAASGMREMFQGMQDLSQEERQAKVTEMAKTMQDRMDAAVKSVESILQPDQLKRLKELAVQTAGPMALVDKTVQQDLNLSADQIAKIKSAGEDAAKKMRELFSGGDVDMSTIGPKMQEMRTDLEKQMLAVLTADQAAAFEKMKGAKLDIPAAELRGPGGFGRGGRTAPPAPN